MPCLLLLMFASAAAFASGPPDDFAIESVAPGVFVHTGRHGTVDSSPRDDQANLAFIVGENCVAVIDSGGSVAVGQRWRDAIRARTAVPICYVINSHVHFDHVLGNAAFRADKPRFVGHARLAEAMEGNREFFAEEFAAEVGSEGSAAVVGPDLLVEESMEIDLGGRVLELRAVPPAHTDTDLVVRDSASGILFTGDLVFMERIPALDASVRGWLKWLNEESAAGHARIVPGHGPAAAPWPEGGAALQRYLSTLVTETRAAVADGVFLEDAKGSVGDGERDRWQFFDEVHRRNVSRAYRELEWE